MKRKITAACMAVFIVLTCLIPSFSRISSSPSGSDEGRIDRTVCEVNAEQVAGEDTNRAFSDRIPTRIIAKTCGDVPDVPFVSYEMIDDYTVLVFGNESDASDAFVVLQDKYVDVSYSTKLTYFDTGKDDYEFLSGNSSAHFIENGIFNARSALLEKYGSVEAMPSVTVAVIDSGIDRNHELFKDRIGSAEYDFASSGKDAQDVGGHGTIVAGIIADLTLPNVKINAYKVNDDEGTIIDSSIAKAIKQAVKDGVDIINLSLGGEGEKPIMKAAIDEALNAGITVIAAAGNEGSDAVNIFPASYAPVITVSALEYYVVNNLGEKDGKIDYSDMEIQWLSPKYANYGVSVDLVAMGRGRVASLGGGYSESFGTSLSAPFVASAAAMYLTYYPDADRTDVERWLKTNAIDFGDAGFDTVTGYGLVNLNSFDSGKLAPAPVFSDVEPRHQTAFSLSLTAEEGYELYYTLDGTSPVINGKPVGQKYTGPITIEHSSDLTVASFGPDSVMNIVRQRYYFPDENLFSDFHVRSNFLTRYLGTSSKVILPSEVSGIAIYGFQDLFHGGSGEKEIVIPDGISYIGDCAFSNSSAEKITIGKDVCRIGDLAFLNCHAEIIVSEDNPYLISDGDTLYSKDGIFYYYRDAEGKERLELPDCITAVQLDHFYECSYLKELKIGKNVTDIDFHDPIEASVEGQGVMHPVVLDHNFRIEVDPGNPHFSSDDAGSLYSKDKTILYYVPCSNENTLTIDGCVRKIGSEAIVFNSPVPTLIFREGIEEILNVCGDTFTSGERKDYYFPATLAYINTLETYFASEAHFWFAGDAPAILQVDNKNNLFIHYYENARGFDVLKEKYPEAQFVPRNDGEYGNILAEYPFENGILYFNPQRERIVKAVNVKGNVTIPEKINGVAVREIGAYAFCDSEITELVLPESVTVIGQGAFRGSSLRSVKILGDVYKIEHESFDGCRALENIEIYGKTEIIGAGAFSKSERTYVTVTLPDSVRILESGAFGGNAITNMEKLPADLEVIEENALSDYFFGMTREKQFELVLPSKLKELERTAFGAFLNTTESRAVIYIGDVEKLAPEAIRGGCVIVTKDLPSNLYAPFADATVFYLDGAVPEGPATVGATFPDVPYYEYLGLELPEDPTEETAPTSDTDVTSADAPGTSAPATNVPGTSAASVPTPETSVPGTDKTPGDETPAILWIPVAVIAAVVIAASVSIAIAVRKKNS